MACGYFENVAFRLPSQANHFRRPLLGKDRWMRNQIAGALHDEAMG